MDQQTQRLETLINDFERVRPDIDISLIPVPDKDDHLTKLTTSFAAGDPPDVFLVNFREYSQFVALGGIEAIEPYLGERGVDLADYYEHPIEAFTYEGELKCMPQNISSLVAYYNPDVFDGAGVERPDDDWTWEDFRRISLDLTSGDVRGLGIDPNIVRIAPFVWGNGGELVDDLHSPTRFTLSEPRARAALEFVVSLVREDEVVPTEREVAAQDLETRFITGKLGMFLSSRRHTPAFREVAGLDFDVLPLPVGSEPAGILHSDAYCIARGSSASEAAADFIAFATGTDGQTITALAGRTVPSLKSVARSAAFLNPLHPPEHAAVFLDGIPHMRRTPVIPTWPEIEDIAEELLTRAFYERNYSMDDFVAELDRRTRPLFAEAREL